MLPTILLTFIKLPFVIKNFVLSYLVAVLTTVLEMAYIQAYSLLLDPEYINIVYICLHANYLNKILFKPTVLWNPKTRCEMNTFIKVRFFHN